MNVVQLDSETKQQIIRGYSEDSEFQEIYDSLLLPENQWTPAIMSKLSHYMRQDELLFYRANPDGIYRLCIPNVGTLRQDILHDAHDAQTSGHHGWIGSGYDPLSVGYSGLWIESGSRPYIHGSRSRSL